MARRLSTKQEIAGSIPAREVKVRLLQRSKAGLTPVAFFFSLHKHTHHLTVNSHIIRNSFIVFSS